MTENAESAPRDTSAQDAQRASEGSSQTAALSVPPTESTRSTGWGATRTPTKIAGLDRILHGGVPERSICVIGGRPGAGKTVLTHQILFQHIGPDCTALYLTTVAEPSIKMVRYMQSFEFSNNEAVDGQLQYLDIAESLREGGIEQTMRLISQTLKKLRPKFVCVDSFKAIDRILGSSFDSGEFAHRMAVLLTTWDAIGILVGEYDANDMREPVFTIADVIVMLTISDQAMYPQRFLEVTKLRGSDFVSGRHPYHISSEGFSIYPRVKVTAENISYPTSVSRVPSGIDEFDEMLSGGLQSGTATMLAGASGTGKTITSLQFVRERVERGERAVIASFQENPEHLERIAESFGWDLAAWKRSGLVEHVFRSPVEIQTDTHFHRLLEAVDRQPTSLVIIDSLRDLETIQSDPQRFSDFLYSAVNELKNRGVTVILTNEIQELFGPFKFSEHGVSFITDAIILLRYVEMRGRMSRAINVVKMRVSEHSKEIREFSIGSNGVQILGTLSDYSGLITGTPQYHASTGIEDLPTTGRSLVRVLQGIGPTTPARLATKAGVSEEEANAELSELELQGMVLFFDQDGERVVRATL